MKKNILLLLIFASVVFVTSSCSKDGIKDKDNGMVKVTFGKPTSDNPKYVVAYDPTTLSGTDFTFDVSKVPGGSVNSGHAAFNEVKSFELSPGTYEISASVTFDESGYTINDKATETVLIEKGKVTEISIY